MPDSDRLQFAALQGDSLAGDRTWVDDAAELLRMVAASDVDLLEVEHEGARFVLRRELSDAVRPTATSEARPQEEQPAGTVVVTAQRVGVFRRTAGSPSEPPVEEGDEVTAGQVVGGVEAMGDLDRVQADRSGVVEQVLVQDGQPVEYGQGLIVIRPE